MPYKDPEIARAKAVEYSRAYRVRNPDKIRQAGAEYRVKNSGKIAASRAVNKDAQYARNREAYRKNRDKVLESQREYYRKNREAVLERQAVSSGRRYAVIAKPFVAHIIATFETLGETERYRFAEAILEAADTNPEIRKSLPHWKLDDWLGQYCLSAA